MADAEVGDTRQQKEKGMSARAIDDMMSSCISINSVECLDAVGAYEEAMKKQCGGDAECTDRYLKVFPIGVDAMMVTVGIDCSIFRKLRLVSEGRAAEAFPPAKNLVEGGEVASSAIIGAISASCIDYGFEHSALMIEIASEAASAIRIIRLEAAGAVPALIDALKE